MRRAFVVAAATLTMASLGLATATLVAWPRAERPDRAPDALASGPPRTDVIAPITAPGTDRVTTRSSSPDALPARVEPVAISVPGLNIEMPVLAYGLTTAGALALPQTATEAAWYRHGGVPGATAETALIAAHVDDGVTGIGEFARLRDARPGDVVDVTLSDGRITTFIVTRVEQVAKAVVDVAQVLDDGKGSLILMTCGGRWDASIGHYEDNVLVWAEATDPPWLGS